MWVADRQSVRKAKKDGNAVELRVENSEQKNNFILFHTYDKREYDGPETEHPGHNHLAPRPSKLPPAQMKLLNDQIESCFVRRPTAGQVRRHAENERSLLNGNCE